MIPIKKASSITNNAERNMKDITRLIALETGLRKKTTPSPKASIKIENIQKRARLMKGQGFGRVNNRAAKFISFRSIC